MVYSRYPSFCSYERHYNLIKVEDVGLESAVELGLAVIPSMARAKIGWSSFIVFWVSTHKLESPLPLSGAAEAGNLQYFRF